MSKLGNWTHVVIEERVEIPHEQCFDRTPSTVREYGGAFYDERAATDNAEALAKKHVGSKFYVCEVVSVSETKPVTTTLRKDWE